MSNNPQDMLTALSRQSAPLIAKQISRNSSRLDRILHGDHWHNNALELTGSAVQLGFTKEQFLKFAPLLTTSGYTVEQTHAEIGRMFDDAIAKGFAPETRVQTIKSPVFQLLSEIEVKPPVWLVDEILIEKSNVGIVGASYTGKSFLAIDLACSVASGVPFHGREVMQGAVAYIAGEGNSGLGMRANAWCETHEVDPQSLPVGFTKTAINVREATILGETKGAIEGKMPNGVRLIIIDTLARNFGGGNENAPNDMNEFIDACSDLGDYFDCTICVVHHTGKDKSAGARGHSAFYAALDTEIIVEAIGDHDIKVSCDKQKDAPEFDDLQFLKVAHGDTIVLEETDPTPSKVRTKLIGNQLLLVKVIQEIVETKVSLSPIKGQRLLKYEVREKFCERHSSDTRNSQLKAFERALIAIQNKGLVTISDAEIILKDIGDIW